MKIVVTLEDGTAGTDYLDSLAAAGFGPEEILVVRSADVPPLAFDGLVLGGGEDVAPELYRQAPRADLRDVNPRRDAQELGLIAAARRRGAPILAICRGIQIVNVACGGSLVQDIPSQRPSAVDHEVKTPKDAIAHTVVSSGARWLPAGSLSVNSRHHQAIGELGSGLSAVARSDDRLIEAVEAEGIAAVQWHPENRKDDPVSVRIFRAFRDAVAARAARE
jgi:putative glutamine amidotransferase